MCYAELIQYLELSYLENIAWKQSHQYRIRSHLRSNREEIVDNKHKHQDDEEEAQLIDSNGSAVIYDNSN